MNALLAEGIIQPTRGRDVCIIGLDPASVLAELRKLDYTVVFATGPLCGIGFELTSKRQLIDVHGFQPGPLPGSRYEARVRVVSYGSSDADSAHRDYGAAQVDGRWLIHPEDEEGHPTRSSPEVVQAEAESPVATGTSSRVRDALEAVASAVAWGWDVSRQFTIPVEVDGFDGQLPSFVIDKLVIVIPDARSWAYANPGYTAFRVVVRQDRIDASAQRLLGNAVLHQIVSLLRRDGDWVSSYSFLEIEGR